MAVPLLGLGGTWVGLRGSFEQEPLPQGPLPAEAAVDGPRVFPKQGEDQCGAYSLALALRCEGQEADPEAVVDRVSHRVSWSETLSGTLPWLILDALEERGLSGRDFTAAGHPAPRRLDLLRQHLAAGQPVLILIESPRQNQHYEVVLGYGPDRIDVYDPNAEADPQHPERTRDLNGPRPGNLSVTAEEFAGEWSRGGGGGLYRWWYVPIRPRR